MVAHPLDELSCHVSGRKSRNALVQKPAISQKFDVSKDRLLARFGSSLAVRQKFRRGSRSNWGRECREPRDSRGPFEDLIDNHEGLRRRLIHVGIPHAALLFVTPFLVAGQLVISRQSVCDAVQSYVNMFVDYTKTTCAPTNASSDTFTFLVLSSEPIFSIKDEKKAWLIAVVLSLGNAMNGAPDVKTGELYVADADLKTNIAYVLPIVVAKALQNDVATGKLQLGAMYEKIEMSLVRKELPKP